MAQNQFNKPHFFFNSSASSHDFTSPSRGGGEPAIIPAKDRASHSNHLRQNIQSVASELSELKSSIPYRELNMGLGIQVEFESFPDVAMAVESLANDPQGIVLHNVKTVELEEGQKTTIATAFVPEGKLSFYQKKLNEYEERRVLSGGRAGDHQKLIDSIKNIKRATFAAIWADDETLLPDDKDKVVWWEVWIATPRKTRATHNYYQEILGDFTRLAQMAEMRVSDHKLRFPEHTVIQLQTSQKNLEENAALLFRVAEIRFPKVTAEFFAAMPNEEQLEWTDELLQRLNSDTSDESPYVCIIDSGVNVDHPLLSPFSTKSDQRTITEDSDPTDALGHGTEMAGLAIWGDMTERLSSSNVEVVRHRLESVKTMRFINDNADKPLGIVTANAVAEVEIYKPERSRVFSMSLSSGLAADRGRPSSWSSAMDMLAVDFLGEGQTPRLFTVCAGNARLDATVDYPNTNYLNNVHDPAQAWNVLTVGAFTKKDQLSVSSDLVPLAPSGGLSPYTTTSLGWDKNNAPFKPEVVFEGGNLARANDGFCGNEPDLHLLTVNSDFPQRHFTTTHATSAATALAARFSAQLKTQYNDLWPETIRALTVHSADWTDEMYALISAKRGNIIRKSDMIKLVRKVGYGVPNLEKALNSADNSLSMVIQDELQPFIKPRSKDTKTKDMHLHNLPWPRDELLKIGEADVELSITLSYFVEPNPSSRNVLDKYNYASHQLRFDVKHHGESDAQFMRRINAQAEGERPETIEDSNWLIGKQQRHKGSIHKDVWRGSAADLAARDKIAIYPAKGWWKTRKAHERYNSKARYALVVSLAVPDVDVDLYSEVQNIIETEVATPVMVEVTN